MTPVAAEGNTHQAPENQLMQMQGIGLIDWSAALEAATPDGEQGFEHRIEQDSQRIEWRNPGIAHHQLNRELRQHEAQEISAAITQEYATERKVPDQEAQRRRGQRSGNQENRNVL